MERGRGGKKERKKERNDKWSDMVVRGKKRIQIRIQARVKGIRFQRFQRFQGFHSIFYHSDDRKYSMFSFLESKFYCDSLTFFLS